MMVKKKKPCDGETCKGELRVIWKAHQGKRYCQSCWKLELPKLTGRKPKPTKAKTKKRIPLISPKRAREQKEYSRLRKIFLERNPMCQAHLPGCTGRSDQVHHKAGRIGKNYLDVTTWLAVDDPCHKWIEAHPKEARELGLSLTKH